MFTSLPGIIINDFINLTGPWKRKNLSEYGIVTQCIAPTRVNDQYLTNVLLKINAKVRTCIFPFLFVSGFGRKVFLFSFLSSFFPFPLPPVPAFYFVDKGPGMFVLVVLVISACRMWFEIKYYSCLVLFCTNTSCSLSLFGCSVLLPYIMFPFYLFVYL